MLNKKAICRHDDRIPRTLSPDFPAQMPPLQKYIFRAN
jgi:hypothetical protein